jgi:cysteine/O-acetylserine efflux protein
MNLLAPFLTYVIVTTFTPGPNNIMAMSTAMRFGYKNSLRFMSGITSGFALIMLLCGLLNVVLNSLLPQVHFWLNILGAMYMLYLAYHVFVSKPIEEAGEQSGLNTFKAGFLMQFLNLKVILYGVTVYALFITPTVHDPMLVSLYAPILAAVGFISISCWAFGGNIFRNFLQKYYRAFNLAMSLMRVYTAIAGLAAG